MTGEKIWWKIVAEPALEFVYLPKNAILLGVDRSRNDEPVIEYAVPASELETRMQNCILNHDLKGCKVAYDELWRNRVAEADTEFERETAMLGKARADVSASQ